MCSNLRPRSHSANIELHGGVSAVSPLFRAKIENRFLIFSDREIKKLKKNYRIDLFTTRTPRTPGIGRRMGKPRFSEESELRSLCKSHLGKAPLRSLNWFAIDPNSVDHPEPLLLARVATTLVYSSLLTTASCLRYFSIVSQQSTRVMIPNQSKWTEFNSPFPRKLVQSCV